MREAALEAAWDALERGEAEAALLHIGARGALELEGAEGAQSARGAAGEGSLCAALAHLDLGQAAEAGPWLDLATRLLGDDEPAVLSARAEWHLARWEGAEASALLAGSEDDRGQLWRHALAEHLAGRHDSATALWSRARSQDAEDGRPLLDEAGFDAVVRAAIAALPAHFRDLLEGVPVVVDAAPTAALFGGAAAARASGIGPDLLGLFAGPSRLERSATEGFDEPARVYLFRHNLEAATRNAEELEQEIGITLYHELGHALGFDEDGVDGLGLA